MTVTMSYTLEEVDPEKDFAELIECEWDSYENPDQTFFKLFCPIHGTGPSARADSVREATARQLDWHESDPTSYWQKVVNKEGKIVGGALWKICQKNPFEHPEDHSEVYWYPKGGQRDYVAQALKLFDAPRMRMAQRPQVYLNIIFTHPDYRRQGIADLIMKWGINKAEAMGVEMWLDATRYGIPVYEKHGFSIVHENNFAPKNDSPSLEWKEMAERLEPMVMWQMWRPIGGKSDDGKNPRPWE